MKSVNKILLVILLLGFSCANQGGDVRINECECPLSFPEGAKEYRLNDFGRITDNEKICFVSIFNSNPDSVSKFLRNKFPNLIDLELNGDSIVDLSFLDLFSCLKSLDLNENRITKLDSMLFDLENLSHLSVSKNNISSINIGTNPQSPLYFLDLSYNNLTEVPMEIFQLDSLKFLVLSHNPILSLPEKIEISNSVKLKEIHLEGTEIECLPNWLAEIPGLKVYVDQKDMDRYINCEMEKPINLIGANP